MEQTTSPHAGIEGSAPDRHDGQRGRNASPAMLRGYLEAISRLEYVASRQRGFALLTGPAGSGKSVLLREFADGLRREGVLSVLVDACGCGEREVLAECCDELGLGCRPGRPAGVLRSALLEAVRGRCAVGMPVVLIVDHADRGGEEGAVRVFERLLHATHETAGPTLVAACREPAPPPLKALARDYADVRIQLPPLNADETGDLVESLSGTGDRNAGVTPEGVGAMHSAASGELRQVNRLWRLLQTAAAVDGADAIDAAMVESMAHELPE